MTKFTWCYCFLTDEGEIQRKRKGEEGEEKNPAKRQSLGTDKVPVPPGATDATASALENLALEKRPADQQAVSGSATSEKQICSGSITSEHSPEEASTGNQHAGR